MFSFEVFAILLFSVPLKYIIYAILDGYLGYILFVCLFLTITKYAIVLFCFVFLLLQKLLQDCQAWGSHTFGLSRWHRTACSARTFS